MIRTVLELSSTARLVALATVKLRLGITDSAQDSLLTDLIDEASSAITDVLDFELARQRYEDRFFGNGRRTLVLGRWPVDPATLTITVDDVAVTDFELDPDSGLVYRQLGWPSGDGEDRNILADYFAGYILPDQIQTWSAALAIDAVAAPWARPSSPSLSRFLFLADDDGTTGGAEPTWPTTAGGAVDDNGITWTAHVAQALPKVLSGVAIGVVRSLFHRRNLDPATTQIQADGFSQSFLATAQSASSGVIPQAELKTLLRWRAAR